MEAQGASGSVVKNELPEQCHAPEGRNNAMTLPGFEWL